jgi:hypothetical protein
MYVNAQRAMSQTPTRLGRQPGSGGPGHRGDSGFPKYEPASEPDRGPQPSPRRRHALVQIETPAAGSPLGSPAGKTLRVANGPSTMISKVASPDVAAQPDSAPTAAP